MKPAAAKKLPSPAKASPGQELARSACARLLMNLALVREAEQAVKSGLAVRPARQAAAMQALKALGVSAVTIGTTTIRIVPASVGQPESVVVEDAPMVLDEKEVRA